MVLVIPNSSINEIKLLHVTTVRWVARYDLKKLYN